MTGVAPAAAAARTRATALSNLLWGLVVGALLAWLVLYGLTAATDPAPTVPPCTDAIADSGGICRGEPAVEA